MYTICVFLSIGRHQICFRSNLLYQMIQSVKGTSLDAVQVLLIVENSACWWPYLVFRNQRQIYTKEYSKELCVFVRSLLPHCGNPIYRRISCPTKPQPQLSHMSIWFIYNSKIHLRCETPINETDFLTWCVNFPRGITNCAKMVYEVMSAQKSNFIILRRFGEILWI